MLLTWHLIPDVPGQVVLPAWAALGSTLGQGVTQGASTIPVESLSVDYLSSERSMHLFSPGNIVLKVCGLTQKRCSHIATSRENAYLFGLKMIVNDSFHLIVKRHLQWRIWQVKASRLQALKLKRQYCHCCHQMCARSDILEIMGGGL